MRRFVTFFILFFLIFFDVGVYAEEARTAAQDFEQAMALKQQGHYSEAEAALKKALEQEPGNADYHFELANVYAMHYDGAGKKKKDAVSREFLDAAARELEQVIMVRPDHMAARFNLVFIFKRKGNYEEAW